MFQTSAAVFRATSRLIRRLRPSRMRLGVTVFLLLVGGVLEGAVVGMLVPLLSMLGGSDSSQSGLFSVLLRPLAGLDRMQKVLVLAGTILALVALKNFVSHLGVASAAKLRARALIELRRQLLERVLRAPPATLEAHTSGEITGAFLSEAIRVNRALDHTVNIVHRGIIATGYLAAVVLLSWQLTLATLGLGVLLGAASMVLSKQALRRGRQLTEANNALGRQITETVGGLRVTRTTASEAIQEKVFAETNRTQALAEVESHTVHSLLAGTTETLGVAGAMCLTALAYRQWLVPGTLDVSRFLAFCFGLLRLMPTLNQVYGAQAAVTSLVGSVEQALRWLDLPRYPARPFGKLPLREVSSSVTFDNVSFGYARGPDVIRGLSFRLPAGERLAVVGASGTGKSTLASLLVRLREPSEGRILFDGVDHWEYAPQDFHRAVALVEQEPFLFNASIIDNVAYGAPWVTREDVLRALEQVQLADFVASLPRGIDTVVGERGATLSGGQKQRLAIARAVVRDPRVLVLDEPTSALDAETEQEVVRAIEAASMGRTTIIITHRASTVERATLRLTLPEGRLERTQPRPVAAVQHA